MGLNRAFILRLAFGFFFAIALLSLPMWSEPMRALTTDSIHDPESGLAEL